MRMPPELSDCNLSRRRFAQVIAASAVTLNRKSHVSLDAPADVEPLPPAFSAAKPLSDRVHPITPDEFHQRIEHAQRLMADATPAPSGSPSQAAKYHALFFSPSTSLYYFTGIRWGLSERLVSLGIPPVAPALLGFPSCD